jgi:16S rRNA (guanine527-N7)-methyltransferase
LVLALRRPDLRVTLVEPLLRRTTFLTEAVETLGLANVEVVRERAEALHGQRTFQVVTSRAVAPLDRLAGWSLPLVAPGGMLLAMKGSSAPAEVEQAAKLIHKLGGRGIAVEEYGADLADAPTTVVKVLVPAQNRGV